MADPSNNNFQTAGLVALARDQNNNLANAGLGAPAGALSDTAWTYPADIDDLRWNQLYPYQVVLLAKNPDGTWRQIPATQFTLPVAPTDLQRQTPPAITTSVTQGGIVEENNGAPIRSLSMSGTTGIFPLRGTGQVLGRLGPANAIFAGTLAGVAGVVQNVKVAAMGPGSLFQPNLIQFASGDTELKGTGYYQFRLLEQWFEQYLALKKSASGSTYALGFVVAKEEVCYRCTLTGFSVSRTAASPLEYNYSLQFKVWGKQATTTSSIPIVADDASNMRSPNVLAAVLTRVQASRRVLASLNNTITGFRTDVNAVVFEPMRQVAFFIKDALGVTITAIDLPVNIVQDMASAIIQFATIPATARNVGAAWNQVGPSISAAFQSINDTLAAYAVTSSIAQTSAGTLSANAFGITNAADPAVKILSNPQNYYEFFESVKPSQLNLSPQTVKAINAQRVTVRQLQQSDFEGFRDQIQGFSDSYATAVGAVPASYATIYGLPFTPTTRIPSEEDYEVLAALNQSIIELNRMCLEPDINNQTTDALQFMQAVAAQSQVPFDLPVSKFAIPFPYGSTLEMLATRYLGDANRWVEIAALNDLRSPYVDETGFIEPLISNGISNYVIVADASLLYNGQTVYISSNSQPRTVRTIIDITQNTPTSWKISVSGDINLNKYTTAAQADLRAFLPGTVNSTKLIFMPSAVPTTLNNFIGKPNPAIAEAANFILIGGADLLLTSDNDIVITPDGDQLLIVGLQNIIQRARLAFSTPQGSLVEHPQYGLPLYPGISVADLDKQQLILATRALFADDPTFVSVVNPVVNINGPSATLSAQINVAGAQNALPLSFALPQKAGA